MKDICVNFLDLDLFFQFLKGLCHGNRFWAKFAKWLFSTCWHFETDSISQFWFENFQWQYILYIRYYANLIKIGPVTQRNCKLCHDLTIVVNLPPGVQKWIGKSQFWILQDNRQSFLYIVWKFGEIRISDTRVLDLRSCTVSIENATILKFAKWPLFNMLAFRIEVPKAPRSCVRRGGVQ